jgi:hypothetical protein
MSLGFKGSSLKKSHRISIKFKLIRMFICIRGIVFCLEKFLKILRDKSVSEIISYSLNKRKIILDS